MSDDARPCDKTAKPRMPGPETASPNRLPRRKFLRGLGISSGIIAAGTSPLISAIAKGTSEEGLAPVPGEELKSAADKALREAAEGDVSINMPAKSIWYAPPPAEKRFGMVIDVRACIGCRKCVYACMKENNIGRNAGFTYIQVLEMEEGSWEAETPTAGYTEGGRPDRWCLPVQSMQCEKPPCVYGSPVKATWKEPDGCVAA